MRLEFFTSLTIAALLAAETFAISITQEEEEDSLDLELGQLWSTQSTDERLASIINGEVNFAELDGKSSAKPSYTALTQTQSKARSMTESETESQSESESEAEAQSEAASNSESDSSNGSSSSDFGTLQLAQQVQELKMINAMGVINAAQVQSMQQMAAMQAMGMMPQQQMGGMGGGMGGQGMGFAQTGAEEDNDGSQVLTQIASTLVSMRPEHLEQVKQHLAQVDSDEEILAQTNTSDGAVFGEIADMLVGLDDHDLAQVVSQIEDMAGQAPTNSATALAETAEAQDDTLDGVAEFLAQLDEDTLNNLDQLFVQISAEPTENILSFAQIGTEENASEDQDDFELLASYLTQLSDEEMDQLSNLVQVKQQQSTVEYTTCNEGDVEIFLAQQQQQDQDDYFDDYGYSWY